MSTSDLVQPILNGIRYWLNKLPADRNCQTAFLCCTHFLQELPCPFSFDTQRFRCGDQWSFRQIHVPPPEKNEAIC